MKKEIDLIRCLLDDNDGGFYTSELIEEVLEKTKIFHILIAIKILKIRDNENWEMPKLDEINQLLSEIINAD